jgi:hypothetical protein
MSQARFNTCVSDDVINKVPPAANFGSYTPDVRPWNKFDGKRIVSTVCSGCDTLDTPIGSVSLPRKEQSKQLFTPTVASLLQITHLSDTRSTLSLPTHTRYFQ